MLNKVLRRFSKINFYDILGLNNKANEIEIKQAYFKLVKKFHPDQNPDLDSQEKFMKVKEAYFILSDPVKKKDYDNWFSQTEVDFEELFKDAAYYDTVEGSELFRRFQDLFMNKKKDKIKGDNIYINVSINFEESITNSTKNIKYKIKDICFQCNGKRAEEYSKKLICEKCHGEGKINYKQGPLSFKLECTSCKGDGYLILDFCKKCKGSGISEKQVTESINIPLGVYTGFKHKINNIGSLNDFKGAKGDLIITFQVKEHDKFKRIKNDIYSSCLITISQSIWGDNVTIDTIYGQKEIQISKNERKIIIPNYGMKDPKSDEIGNHIVEVKVYIPKIISMKQKEIWEKIKNLNESPHKYPNNTAKEEKKIYNFFGLFN